MMTAPHSQEVGGGCGEFEDAHGVIICRWGCEFADALCVRAGLRGGELKASTASNKLWLQHLGLHPTPPLVARGRAKVWAHIKGRRSPSTQAGLVAHPPPAVY
jgi:hypothetical protein